LYSKISKYLLIALTTATTIIAAQNNWSKWRGPNANGISIEKNWNPKALSTTSKPIWTTKLGSGYSSVCIQNNHLYSMGFKNNKDYIYCLDATTGKQIWQKSYNSNKGGGFKGPRATPVYDNGKLYVFSLTGDIKCLNAKTGEFIWETNCKKFGSKDVRWHYAASPYIYKDLLILNAGSAGLALNKNTGKKVWSSSGIGGYSTPVFFQQNKIDYIALFSEKNFIIVKATTGKKILQYPWITNYNINAADPIIENNEAFISSGYKKGCAKIKLQGTTGKTVWKNRSISSQFNSTILYKGYLYGFDGNTGRKNTSLVCLNWKTGKEQWRQKTGFSSLIIVDGKIIAINEKGHLFIAEASPKKFIRLSETKIKRRGVCWTAPVFCNGKLYCRDSSGNLFCYDLSK